MSCNPVSDIVIHADVRFVYVSWVNPNISTIFREIALQFNGYCLPVSTVHQFCSVIIEISYDNWLSFHLNTSSAMASLDLRDAYLMVWTPRYREYVKIHEWYIVHKWVTRKVPDQFAVYVWWALAYFYAWLMYWLQTCKFWHHIWILLKISHLMVPKPSY
jgi:hypothetical protein